MNFGELDWVSVLLRMLVYVATIAVAGGVFVRATLGMQQVAGTINRQIFFGAILLLVCEPLRYLTFQLSIAQGDWEMAFDPAMRWMGVETPLGQAAGVRFLGTLVVVTGIIWRPLAVVGALVVVGAYLIEGHTLSDDSRVPLAALLFVHLVVVHWWIGALLPLRSALAVMDTQTAASTVERFGRIAVVGVGVLFVAGAILLATLTGWQLVPTQAYQQGFALKLLAFIAILLVAAVNKLRWTPKLATNPDYGRSGLRTWLTIETIIAATVLAATAAAISFPPKPDL